MMGAHKGALVATVALASLSGVQALSQPLPTAAGTLPLPIALAGGGGRSVATAAEPPAVVGDGVPASLTGMPGDPARGRAIVADRTRGLCLLCHGAPIPEERFQGDLAPNLAGAGSRWSVAQLRLRIASARRLNPDTIMPSYLGDGRLVQVGQAFRDKPILAPGDIEDVVAYLATLTEP